MRRSVGEHLALTGCLSSAWCPRRAGRACARSSCWPGRACTRDVTRHHHHLCARRRQRGRRAAAGDSDPQPPSSPSPSPRPLPPPPLPPPTPRRGCSRRAAGRGPRGCPFCGSEEPGGRERGRRVERPEASRPQRLPRQRPHHGHGPGRRGRGRRGAGERPRAVRGQPTTRREHHPHRKARRGEGEPRLESRLAHHHGSQPPRRGHYGGGRGFDRARRHLAGSSGQVSVSATASSPATRRATSELKSWECVGAQLSELPQLWRRAATSRTCLSISVWRAPIGGCGSRTLRQRVDLPVEERQCQLVMQLRPWFEGLGESGRATTVGCRAALARAPRGKARDAALQLLLCSLWRP